MLVSVDLQFANQEGRLHLLLCDNAHMTYVKNSYENWFLTA
jgi:hypothetical protein